MSVPLLLLAFLVLSLVSASVDEFSTPSKRRSCGRSPRAIRRGWCQCPQDCQFTMLGLTARPLCFSSYPQPLITCAFPFHGTCISLNNELLPYCHSYPPCVFPVTPTETSPDPRTGKATVVDLRALKFWIATFEAPSGSQILADTYCSEGYTARCVQLVPIF